MNSYMYSTNNNIVLVAPVAYLRERGSRSTGSHIDSPSWWRATEGSTLFYARSNVSRLPGVSFVGYPELLVRIVQPTPSFAVKRSTVNGRYTKQGSFDPFDLVPRMLEFPASWEAVLTFVGAVMSFKEEARRARDLKGEPKFSPSSRKGDVQEFFLCIT